MRKLLLFIIPVVLIIGCGTTPVTISAPTNLAITGANGLQVSFSWVESETEGIDGYIFFLNDTLAFDTVGTVSSATVEPPSLGSITLKAYKGDDMSDPSNAVELTVVTGTNDTIWDFDTPNPSGFGWDANGNGKVYSFQVANEESIDIYLDRDFDLSSPHTYAKWDTAYVIELNGDDEYAPETGYGYAVSPVADGWYAIKIPGNGPNGGDQYVKLHVTAVNQDTFIVFDYTFQPLENYRRFK